MQHQRPPRYAPSTAAACPPAEVVFRALPRLLTPRLCLRKVCLDDAHDLFAYASDPQVSRYVLWQTHSGLMDAYHFLKAMVRKYQAGEVTEWGIEHRASGTLIGTVGFVDYQPEHHRAEVGYALARSHWGQGLATEALHAVAQYGFGQLHLHRLEARTVAENIASQHVLHKVGFEHEGELKGHVYIKGHRYNVRYFGLLRQHYCPVV